MTSHLHVCLRLDADTAIETDAASKLGPHLRIGDGQEAVDLWLPFDDAKALKLCRRMTDALTTLDLAEHGTAASAPR
ncbi:MAG: hypothetical protein HOV67_32700 [Kribbellaceae bacterium]|nr:hypothetical protein [Kribbellaceae bacterium]